MYWYLSMEILCVVIFIMKIYTVKKRPASVTCIQIIKNLHFFFGMYTLSLSMYLCLFGVSILKVCFFPKNVSGNSEIVYKFVL